MDRQTDRRNVILSQRKLPDTRFSGGRGSTDFPYIITTAEQFKLLAEFHDTSRYFHHIHDLDLGVLSTPPGMQEDQMVTAVPDCDGHTVSYRMESVTPEEPFGVLFYAYVPT